METTVEHRHLKNYCIIDFMQSNIKFYGTAKNIVGQYFWHYQIWETNGRLHDCSSNGNWRKVHLCITTQMLICLLSKLIS
jgi:hypothetical protein